MGQVFNLPEGFSLRKTWPKSTADILFQSIIRDAKKDLKWKISSEDNTIHPPVLRDSKQRKKRMQSILNTRVKEQQKELSYRENLEELKSKVISELFIPEEFPVVNEEVIDLFSEVHIEAVVTNRQKEIFRYLRHSWRIPYKTTPGRTLSFLVRIGVEKKVAGIFSLASPAMWMSNRDEALGFENFDVLELSEADNEKLKTYLEEMSLNDPRLSKKELQELKSEFKLDLQRPDWIRRWVGTGLADDCKNKHHLSGNFSVSELLHACMNSLEKRILQFPIREISDEEDFEGKCNAIGISIEATKPTNWITGTEPKNNPTQIKDCEKRRRIVKECILAYEVMHEWKTEGFPVNVADLFESLHGLETSIGSRRLSSLKTGIRESKTRMISSNIAEMIICGSIPPLNPLRVGKLIAMLALSSETKTLWDSTYSTSSSQIASNLAGRPISKPARLSAISTTGLYGRSNAQYSRISIPSESGLKIRFSMVGVTGNKGEGPSNLMISDKSWILVSKLIEEHGAGEGISGKFGEGTSARIRRLQKAIQIMNAEVSGGANVNLSFLLKKIISNPFSRSIHVSNLSHNSIRFHLGIDETPLIKSKPLAKDNILQLWRERWLVPLITRDQDGKESALLKVKNCDITSLLPPYE